MLVLILGFGGSLLGCSTKPDVSDIAADLNKAWESCPLVKISNLKKTNGIDNGNSYRMAFSYTLDVLYDAKDIDEANKHCSIGDLDRLARITGTPSFNKGDVVTITNEIDMIKSEKGWITK
jgi:hypothetical protein